jgi:hypothetical protein
LLTNVGPYDPEAGAGVLAKTVMGDLLSSGITKAMHTVAWRPVVELRIASNRQELTFRDKWVRYKSDGTRVNDGQPITQQITIRLMQGTSSGPDAK